jgi:DNA repair protein RecO
VSYHIYTTKGLVLSERPLKEADRIYSILTRDLGLVRASATGVRKESSKLRGALEPFALSSVSLVRGKDFWRLTSSELLQKLPGTEGLARPFALLEKLVQGESAHPELFDAIETAIRGENGDKRDNISFVGEEQLVASILYHLGYLKEADLTLDKKSLIKAINDGLHSSQLA